MAGFPHNVSLCLSVISICTINVYIVPERKPIVLKEVQKTFFSKFSLKKLVFISNDYQKAVIKKDCIMSVIL